MDDLAESKQVTFLFTLSPLPIFIYTRLPS
jgi:hypothetical protein